MMNKSQFFDFEDESEDFPFYRQKNFISTKNGIILTLSVVLFILLVFVPIRFQSFELQLIFFLITVIPLLYVNNGNLNSIFRRIGRRDFPLIISCFLGSELFYRFLVLLFIPLHFKTSSPPVTIDALNIGLVANLFQIIGEEIFKMILFLLLLSLLYKVTNNRKTSVILAVLIVLPVFGLLHLNTFNYNIIQVLLIQGFGSIFEMYPYIKTKNLTFSVIIHLLVNISSDISMFMV